MAKLLEKNDNRLDATQNLVAALDLKVTEIERSRRLDSERGFAVRLTVGSLLATQLATLILILIKLH